MKVAAFAFIALVAAAPTWAGEASAEELSLGRTIELARQKAPEMRTAKARIASAEGALAVARAGYYPTLTALGTGSESANLDKIPTLDPKNPNATLVTYTSSAIAAAQLRWTVFDFGRTGNNVDAAGYTLSSATAAAADIEAQLVQDATNFYLNAVYGERLRDIAQSVVQQRDKSMAITKGLVKSGLQPAVEELRATSRLESARRDLENADASARDAHAALLGFLAMDVGAGGGGKSTTLASPHLARVMTDVSRAMHDAEDKRPAVLAAKHNVTSEESQLDLAKSRYWPSINLNGDLSWRVYDVDTTVGGLESRAATGTVLLTIPVFDASIPARVQAARADLASAEAAYDQTARDAKTEAARAVIAMESSDRVKDHAKKAADAAGAVLAVMQARYAQGLSGPLDLIQAEGDDADARSAVVRADLAYEAAIVRVLFAVGQIQRITDR